MESTDSQGSMGPIHFDPVRYPERWLMLSLIFVATLQLTLNWFNVVDSFPGIIQAFNIGIVELGLIIGVFLGAYGVFHIPAGLLANKVGYRTTLILGLFIESTGAVLSGLAPTFPMLLGARVVAGVGTSLVAGTTLGFASAWFREAEIGVANGLIGGVGFSLGAAVILLGGVPLSDYFGWRNYLVITGVVGFAILALVAPFIKGPPNEPRLTGGRVTKADIKEVFLSKQLWFLGLSILGGYGSYLTLSQLIPQYAATTAGFSPFLSSAASSLLVLYGIPGGFFGGYLTDRLKSIKYAYSFSLVPAGISFFLLIPQAYSGFSIWTSGFLTGFFFISAFSAFVAAPGAIKRIAVHNLTLAAGLLLSLSAIGGFFVPILFGVLVAQNGYGIAWSFLGLVTLAPLSLLVLVREPLRQEGQ